MTDKEIFNRALKKAKDNGFDFRDGDICWLQDKEPILKGWEYLKHKRLVFVGVDSTTHTYMGLNDIIFSHEVANAFWGEEDCDDCSPECIIPNSTDGDHYGCGFYEGKKWEYNLMMMVLEKEPLKYLERFL